MQNYYDTKVQRELSTMRNEHNTALTVLLPTVGLRLVSSFFGVKDKPMRL